MSVMTDPIAGDARFITNLYWIFLLMVHTLKAMWYITTANRLTKQKPLLFIYLNGYTSCLPHI